jgi:hypothetical protein
MTFPEDVRPNIGLHNLSIAMQAIGVSSQPGTSIPAAAAPATAELAVAPPSSSPIGQCT